MQNEIKNIAAVIVPYSLIMPSVYLYFYWKHFNIQPFEFISVTDSISYAFKPFIIILLTIVPLCFSIGINAKDRTRQSDEKEILPKGMSLSFIVTFNAAIFLFAEFGIEISYWEFGIGAALVVMCSIIMSYEKGFNEVMSSSAARVTLFLILSLSPCFTVFSAQLNSKSTIYSCNSSYILSSDLKTSEMQPKEKLVYLGKLSENMVFFKKNSKEVVIYNLSDLKRLPRKSKM